jgi:flagellar biosynthesis protein FliQ
MDAAVSDLIQQAWRVGLLVALPAFIVPVAGGVSSLLLGLFGIRDEGLTYAIRVLAMVAVAALCIPACSDDVVALMRLALQ